MSLSLLDLVFSTFSTAPDFVSSLEDGDNVYFFFRESAVEYINCGKVSHLPHLIFTHVIWILFGKIKGKLDLIPGEGKKNFASGVTTTLSPLFSQTHTGNLGAHTL